MTHRTTLEPEPQLGHVDYDAHCRETERLEAEIKSAWCEGAEAMRKACKDKAFSLGDKHVAVAIATLPIPTPQEPSDE